MLFGLMLMMVPRATPMAMRVVMLPTSRTFCRISISAITVTELVVEEPPRYPVWAIGRFGGEVPVPLSMRVAILGDTSHSFVLRVLFNVAPVERGLSLAVLFEVIFLRR
jgi:hypothetical protein